MPVVFIHGVNVRKGPNYETSRSVTSKFLEKNLLGAKINGKTLSAVRPTFPFWGDMATSFAWNMASLPSEEIDALGAGVEQDLRPLVSQIADLFPHPAQAQDEPLTTLAKNKNFGLSVELLSRLLHLEANESSAEHIASFIVAAQEYAKNNPSPVWLPQVTTDNQLMNRLTAELKKQQPSGVGPDSLGAFDLILNPLAKAGAKLKQAMKNAAGTVIDRAGDFASTKLLSWGRNPLNETLGRFFGDVFIYFESRGDKDNPGRITKHLLDSIDQAVKAESATEPLVIIGHSLGGVITFDLLSHYSEREVDLFVTVGSQVAHFEELKLFHSSDKGIPNAAQTKARTPTNIKRWINIYDIVDIFSYSAKRVFDAVDDFGYDTQTYTIKAHSAYFEQRRFYERLRHRIDNP